MQKPDRRKHQRVKTSFISKIPYTGTETYGYVDHISLTGIGMFCGDSFPIGRVIHFDLNDPGYRIMQLTGCVVWKKETVLNSESGFSYGIEIASKPVEFEQYIESLLQNGSDSPYSQA